MLSHSVVSDSANPWTTHPARLLWDFPGKTTGVDCHFLLQRIFLTHGSDSCLLCLLHWQVDSLSLNCRKALLKKQIKDIYWNDPFLIPSLFSFSVISVAQSCPTLCDPMNHSAPALPVHHQLPESTQTHVHWVGDAIQPSHPLLSLSPPALNLSQNQGLFKWVSSSH